VDLATRPPDTVLDEQCRLGGADAEALAAVQVVDQVAEPLALGGWQGKASRVDLLIPAEDYQRAHVDIVARQSGHGGGSQNRLGVGQSLSLSRARVACGGERPTVKPST
jgi:hypothetical protein